MSFWKNLWTKIRRKAKEEVREVLDWFKETGIPEMEAIWDRVSKLVWDNYKDKIMQIVLDIAAKALKGEAPKKKAFTTALKEMLDTNDDGIINFDDIPKSVINFIREYAVRLFDSLGDSDEIRIKALTKILEKD